jgi:hypothetical protein
MGMILEVKLFFIQNHPFNFCLDFVFPQKYPTIWTCCGAVFY